MQHFPEIRLRSGRVIGHGRPCFLVAEIGNNHQGCLVTAREMVHAAARAGVDAVKFQKRDTGALLTRAGRERPYASAASFGRTYGEHRDALELSPADMAELKALATSLGLVFFASVWDEVSLARMVELGVELVKVASADLTSVPLLRAVGATGVPVVASTGMSDWLEIDRGVKELRAFHDRIVLLHCNSSYPCVEREICLPVMQRLRTRYGLPVGYSGHERGLAPSVAAVTLGACLVERHFTLDKTLPGSDHKASLEPDEMALLSRMIREVEKAMAGDQKRVFPTERQCARKLRKSIVMARPLVAGTILDEADLAIKSPGDGISPLHWDEIVGRRLTRDMEADEALDWDAVEDALSQPRA